MAILEEGGGPLFEGEMFSSVADAIRKFGEGAPDDLIRFMEVKYSGCSIGTVPTIRMKSESEVLASLLKFSVTYMES